MSLAEQLKQTDLFKEVELADLEALITRMEEHDYRGGEVLFREGDAGDTMYIIQSGRIRIYTHTSAGEDIVLTHYGKNEIFGELSPIDQRPRSASAAAEDDLHVLALDRAHFLALLNDRPQIGLAMMRSLVQRLRNTTTFVEEYKPGKEPVVAPSSTAFSRQAAQGVLADILDRAGGQETKDQFSVEVPDLVEVPYKGDLPPAPPEAPPKLANKGIFDRLGGAIQAREEKDDKPSE